jgi:hypothetical protein
MAARVMGAPIRQFSTRCGALWMEAFALAFRGEFVHLTIDIESGYGTCVEILKKNLTFRVR